jgi:hypothetical protein
VFAGTIVTVAAKTGFTVIVTTLLSSVGVEGQGTLGVMITLILSLFASVLEA